MGSDNLHTPTKRGNLVRELPRFLAMGSDNLHKAREFAGGSRLMLLLILIGWKKWQDISKFITMNMEFSTEKRN